MTDKVYYYTAPIPMHTDGRCAVYYLGSGNYDGWAGTMSRCPKKTEVLMFDERRHFLVARAWDEFIPPEVTVIPEDEAFKLIALADITDNLVFHGKKLEDRRIERMTQSVVGGDWMKEAIAEVSDGG